MLTNVELRNIHARSGNPQWRRMLDFLRRAKSHRLPPDVKIQPQKNVKACQACFINGAPPQRVKIALPHHEGHFKEETIVDAVSVTKEPVLSIIDRDTRYLSCCYLSRLNAASIWDFILRGWYLRYLGIPKL